MIIQVHYDTMYYYDVVSTAMRTEEQVSCIRVMWEIFKKSFCHFANDI